MKSLVSLSLARSMRYYFYLALLFSTVFGTAFAAVDITQSRTDLNGGFVAIGDTLQYNVTVTNNTGGGVTNATVTSRIPIGTNFVNGSLIIDGVGQSDSLVTGDDVKTITHTKSSMAAAETTTIQFQSIVQGSPLLFVDAITSPDNLYTIDKTTGAATLVSGLTGQEAVYGLALTSDGRYAYGVDSNDDTVFYYDFVTDTTNEVGPINLGNVGVPCLDFDLSGNLYGIDSKAKRVIQLNTITGAGTVISTLDMAKFSGGDCAFGSDGQLYVLTNNNESNKGNLWVVDINTGVSENVGNVSNTEFFTGVALGADGNLYASGRDTDTTWSIDPTTAAGSSIGVLTIPHTGGDMAMTASQKLTIVSSVDYTDDQGNDTNDEEDDDIIGDPPPVGDDDPIEEVADQCDPLVVSNTCDLVAEGFLDKWATHKQNVLLHHFLQVEQHAANLAIERGLDEAQTFTFLQNANAQMISDKSAADAEIQVLIDDWFNAYNGLNEACPDDGVLTTQIEYIATQWEAKSANNMYGTAPFSDTASCHITVNRTEIQWGNSTVLAWASTGGDSYEITPIGVRPDTGYTVIHHQGASLAYNMSVKDNGVEVATCGVVVNVVPACGLVLPIDMTLGETVNLTWNYTSHSSASIDQGVGTLPAGQVIGSTPISPAYTTTYTMSTYHDGDPNVQNTCQAMIKVYGPNGECLLPPE